MRLPLCCVRWGPVQQHTGRPPPAHAHTRMHAQPHQPPAHKHTHTTHAHACMHAHAARYTLVRSWAAVHALAPDTGHHRRHRVLELDGFGRRLPQEVLNAIHAGTNGVVQVPVVGLALRRQAQQQPPLPLLFLGFHDHLCTSPHHQAAIAAEQWVTWVHGEGHSTGTWAQGVVWGGVSAPSSSSALASAMLVVMTPMNRFRIIMLASTTKEAKYLAGGRTVATEVSRAASGQPHAR